MKIEKVTFENQGSDSKVYAEFSGDTTELQAYFVSLLGGGAPVAHSDAAKEDAKPSKPRGRPRTTHADTHEAPVPVAEPTAVADVAQVVTAPAAPVVVAAPPAPARHLPA